MLVLGAEPQIGNIQSTPSYAATEVLAFMADPSWEAFDEISFWGQDAWSIGCILAWLVTGEDPFAGCEQEGDAGAMLHCLLQRHAALVRSSADNTNMLPKFQPVTQGPLQCHAALLSLMAHNTSGTDPSVLDQCMFQRHAALVR